MELWITLTVVVLAFFAAAWFIGEWLVARRAARLDRDGDAAG